MNTSYQTFYTADEFELSGLLYEPSALATSNCLIHVHGLAGNFYENSFVHKVAESLCECGTAVLTFNNRGHDYLADIPRRTPSGVESSRIGAANEVFEDSVLDIESAIRFLRTRGYTNIYLQGHSSGANKVIWFLIQSTLPIRGISLLSPCDDRGLLIDHHGLEFDKLIEAANQLVLRGQGDQMMPEGTLFTYPITARAFINHFGRGAVCDMFAYRDGVAGLKSLEYVKAPLLVTFGGERDYVLEGTQKATEMLRKAAVNCPSFTSADLINAGHSYRGHEEALAEAITRWCNCI